MFCCYLSSPEMKRIHYKIRYGILQLIDFFYPLFKRFMPLQTYRYAACGGSNTLLNIFIYFVTYNFVLHTKMLKIGALAISAHIAAFLIAFCITFPTGFYLSMFVVFQGSHLRKRIQLLRYLLVVLICLFLNYGLLKLFVEYFHFYPTPSLILTTFFVVAFSYVSQKYFSFRSKEIQVTLK